MGRCRERVSWGTIRDRRGAAIIERCSLLFSESIVHSLLTGLADTKKIGENAYSQVKRLKGGQEKRKCPT